MSKVVVVIPAYNEAPVIRGVVEGVRALGYPVLVVDDGSTDDTAHEASMGSARVIRYGSNHGVGATLDFGIGYAIAVFDADIIVTFDADGQHDPADIASLVAALADCDLANGSRFLGSVTGIPWTRWLLLKLIYVAFWLLSGREITDTCNGLKAFRPSTFKVRSHRQAYAVELCWRVSRWGRIKEVPVSVRYTDYSLKKGQRSRDAVKVGLELARSLKGE